MKRYTINNDMISKGKLCFFARSVMTNVFALTITASISLPLQAVDYLQYHTLMLYRGVSDSSPVFLLDTMGRMIKGQAISYSIYTYQLNPINLSKKESNIYRSGEHVGDIKYYSESGKPHNYGFFINDLLTVIDDISQREKIMAVLADQYSKRCYLYIPSLALTYWQRVHVNWAVFNPKNDTLTVDCWSPDTGKKLLITGLKQKIEESVEDHTYCFFVYAHKEKSHFLKTALSKVPDEDGTAEQVKFSLPPSGKQYYTTDTEKIQCAECGYLSTTEIEVNQQLKHTCRPWTGGEAESLVQYIGSFSIKYDL